MKFGGTSVGGAERIRALADIVAGAHRETRVAVVVSAVAGMTNHLIDSAKTAADGAPIEPLVQRFASVHESIVAGLGSELGEAARVLREGLGDLANELDSLLRGVSLLQDCSPRALAHISGLGERATAMIVEALLRSRTLPAHGLDSRQYIRLSGDPLQATPHHDETRERFRPVVEGRGTLFVLPGFFGGDERGKTMLLGRGGSDFSAAIVAAAMNADLLEIWTDVDGIYSADPRVVPEAFPLPEVSFEEAMELSYFGAKVLHPKTVAPARERGIAVRVCNSFRPDRPGTLVKEVAEPPPHAVRGISFLKGIALLNVTGPGMKGVPGVAARVFAAMAARDISVILITQASSECSISFCITETDAERAVAALNDAFEAEIAAGKVDAIEVQGDRCILSIVGDGMHARMGVAGTLFGSLAAVGCNVVAIAQGSSERNISVVIDARDGERAMNSVHRRFFDSREIIELYLWGVGTVGSRLIAAIERTQPKLMAQNIDLRICGLSDSKAMALDPRGITPGSWRESLAGGQTTDIRLLIDWVRNRRPMNPVFVDCTTDESTSRTYTELFEGGLHVVTANKKANSAEQAYYKALRRTANRWQRKFLYETNVGAGLPVIDTLKNLVKSGDRVIRFEGILSGSLSFIYGLLEEGVSLSEAVATAKESGFTEPDPRDDLSGLDVARKVLILGRESGWDGDLADVVVEGALPADFDASGDVASFMRRLEVLDERFRGLTAELRSKGMVLRFCGTIDAEGCRVGPVALPADHPLAAVRGGENALSFLTEHYQPRPLVIRGYGAGADVTAAGVLADVLRVVFWNTE